MVEDYTLQWDDELPVKAVPGTPNWSENYAFYGYDFDNRTGFLAFAGRWLKNPQLWREQLYVYLPDQTLLSHRAIAPARGTSSLSAGALSFSCESPGKRWQLLFEGAMRHDDFQTLCHEPILEGRPLNVRFEAVAEGNTPALMFASKDNTTHGKYHYEQGHICKGTVAFNGSTHAFNGVGYRDHSRGPRHLGAFDGHIWLQLFFPDGAVFATYQVWAREGKRSERALDDSMAIISGHVRPATLLKAPRLNSMDNLYEPIELSVAMSGKNYFLHGTALSSFPNSFTEDFDFYFGIAPSIAEFMSIDQPVLFESDVGPVRGYVQRSMRISESKRKYV